jgi:hypothetical protein
MLGCSLGNLGIIGFVDSDYVGDLDKRRSRSHRGYVFTMFSCVVRSKEILQSAEYMAIVEACREATSLRGPMIFISHYQNL